MSIFPFPSFRSFVHQRSHNGWSLWCWCWMCGYWRDSSCHASGMFCGSQAFRGLSKVSSLLGQLRHTTQRAAWRYRAVATGSARNALKPGNLGQTLAHQTVGFGLLWKKLKRMVAFGFVSDKIDHVLQESFLQPWWTKCLHTWLNRSVTARGGW